ncbi:MAG TPA: hypothetical protein VGF76_26455, partial [Polyangiaceae bacterium]
MLPKVSRAPRLLASRSFALGLVLSACAGSNAPSEPAPSAPTAAQVARVLAGGRTPSVLPVTGDPNGLWWDDPSQTLYIADDDGNRILSWNADRGAAVVRQLPSVTQKGDGVGQLVRMANGSLLVTCFGQGEAGGVALVPRNGEPSLIPALDVKRRRIGLTLTDDGRVFDTWFLKSDSGERAGAVAELSLNGIETDKISGLKKPVGVLAIGDMLFVSDQDLGEVLRAQL